MFNLVSTVCLGSALLDLSLYMYMYSCSGVIQCDYSG